ncbi:MAG: response regulator [Candidatus Acidiferrales bacterium]
MSRILIADDHREVRNQIRSFLAAFSDWEVCGEAANGRDAVLKAQLRPDLVILDVGMPMMDGLQAAREIGRMLRGVPILFFTVTNSPELQRVAKEAGVQQVVVKSDGLMALANAVSAHVPHGPQ